MEKPVIYLDTLLAVNLFINYVLLRITAKFLGMPVQKRRLLLGALAGSAGALVILLPMLSFWLDHLTRLLLSCIMVLLSFRIRSLRQFIRTTACLFGASFSLAGFLLMLSGWFHPAGLVLKNSAVYVAVSPIFLLIAVVLCYLGLRLLYRITGRRQDHRTLCEVTLAFRGKEVTLTMGIDTGNHLTEPFSGLPVAVADQRALRPILPDGFPVSGKAPFRMVPCHTVAGERVLSAFRPERCTIRVGKTVIETTSFFVGISPEPLLADCDGLLQPEILSMGEERREDPMILIDTEANK